MMKGENTWCFRKQKKRVAESSYILFKKKPTKKLFNRSWDSSEMFMETDSHEPQF